MSDDEQRSTKGACRERLARMSLDPLAGRESPWLCRLLGGGAALGTATAPEGKNRWVELWFQRFARGWLRRSFHRVLLAGFVPGPLSRPLLVCVNRFRGPDPLVGFWLSAEVLGWDAYAPMEVRWLRHYPVLSRIGAFEVDHEGGDGGREFVESARQLLGRRPRALWIPPRGGTCSHGGRPARLDDSVARLAQAMDTCDVMTVAIDYEVWEGTRPEVFVHFGPVRPALAVPPRLLLRELEAAMEAQIDELATLRRSRDVSLFEVALQGSGSIRIALETARRRRARRREPFGAARKPSTYGPAPARRA